jgi:acyl carrier protein
MSTTKETLDNAVLVAVQEFVSERFANGQPVASDDALLGSLVDSLGIMVFVEFLETQFAISVPDNELTSENLADVRSVVALVQRMRSPSPPNPGAL